jgi:AcrR family transcriptional regulator
MSQNQGENIVQKNELKQRTVPAQKRAETTLQHILATSAQLLAEVGIDGFNTNLLAERADLRVATIYRYFPNKIAILCALVQQWEKLLREEALKPINSLADPNIEWQAAVNDIIDSYVKAAMQIQHFKEIRRALLAVPELRAIERNLGNDLSALMVTALKRRGAKASDNHLHQVARTFILAGATIYDVAASRGKKDKRLKESTLEELRLLLTGYLANYLD